MAFKVRDYSGGDVFVPGSSFGAVEAKPQGPKVPSVTSPGGAIEITQRGTAYGAVRDTDGTIMSRSVRKVDKSTNKPHMPENA